MVIVKLLFFVLNQSIFDQCSGLFSDTYCQAKSYAAKTRIYRPVNYSDENPRPKRRRLSDHAKKIDSLKNEIKVKCERLTSLQRAIRFLNQKSDKHKIENLDPMDVAEFDDLLSDREEIDDVVAYTSTQKEKTNYSDTGPPQSPSIPIHPISDDDDVIEIGSMGRAHSIRTGIEPLRIDEDFSMQYGFTENVGFILDFHNRQSARLVSLTFSRHGKIVIMCKPTSR